MKDLRVNKWEESYNRKENYIFYPKEEVVKFLSRYIKKKTGVHTFQNHISGNQKLRALDLGCGTGRQTILFEEYGIEGYGVDISQNALREAKELAQAFGHDLSERFILLDKNELPFKDNFFDIAISDSVLDSMKFKFALQYLQELNRTVKRMVYLSLICSDSSTSGAPEDIIVDTGHEEGTIQSYYDENRINDLIKNTQFKIKQLNKTTVHNLLDNETNARFHIVLEKG